MRSHVSGLQIRRHGVSASTHEDLLLVHVHLADGPGAHTNIHDSCQLVQSPHQAQVRVQAARLSGSEFARGPVPCQAGGHEHVRRVST